jgi:peptidoglycan/xylan/chitin deacetylase (PgdA/CDA1 family)
MLSRSTANPLPIPILTYHQIADAPPKGTPFRSLYVSPGAFGRQMAWLKLLGYTGLSMSALEPYLSGERRGKVVGLTFDDGYVNNLSHALPVLQKHGFSATCYGVSQLLGQTNVWDREVGIPPAPLMTAQQLRDWVAGGQELGAHTRHHAHLNQCSSDESRDEIAGCKAELEAAVGAPVAHFCYPYGEFGDTHADQVQQAGYRSATTTVRGRAWAQQDSFRLPRVPVVRSTTLATLWLKIATAYEDRHRA